LKKLKLGSSSVALSAHHFFVAHAARPSEDDIQGKYMFFKSALVVPSHGEKNTSNHMATLVLTLSVRNK
jgi:hypothetical protein